MLGARFSKFKHFAFPLVLGYWDTKLISNIDYNTKSAFVYLDFSVGVSGAKPACFAGLAKFSCGDLFKLWQTLSKLKIEKVRG